jgi:tetratricopeptide (TPR) repeat protein
MRARSWTALFVVTLAASAAFAQPSPRSADEETVARVEQLHLEGAALYRAGRYREAAARFERAYGLFPEPNLLYNAARCRAALGELGAATRLYRRFLAHPEVAADARRKARAQLAALRRARQRTRSTPMESPQSDPRAPAPRTGARRIGGWLLLGTSVLAAAGGTASFRLGARDHDRVQAAMDDADGGVAALTRAEAVEVTDAGNIKKWVGVGLWAAAGAALVSSVVLLTLPEERGVTLGGALTPGGAALLLGSAF